MLRYLLLFLRVWALLIMEIIVSIGRTLRLFYRQKRTLNERVVLITGAAGAVGLELTKRCVQLGATVVGVDVDHRALERAQMKIALLGAKGSFQPERCDVSDYEAVKELVERVLQKYHQIHVLVNNAAITKIGSIIETDPADIRRVIEVDLLAYFWVLKCVLPSMVRAGAGHVVSVGSLASYVCTTNLAAYVAAKHAVLGLHECLEMELAENIYTRAQPGAPRPQIDTTCVMPCIIDTPLFAGCHSADHLLFPTLKPADVAEKILDGIIHRRRRVYVPPRIRLVHPLKLLLPFSVGMEMMRESGGSLMMDTYTGANRAKSSYLPPASSASTSSSTAAGGSHYAAGEGLRRRAQRE